MSRQHPSAEKLGSLLRGREAVSEGRRPQTLSISGTAAPASPTRDAGGLFVQRVGRRLLPDPASQEEGCFSTERDMLAVGQAAHRRGLP